MKLIDYVYAHMYIKYKYNPNVYNDPPAYAVYILSLGIWLWLMTLVYTIYEIIIVFNLKHIVENQAYVFVFLLVSPIPIMLIVNHRYVSTKRFLLLYEKYSNVEKSQKLMGAISTGVFVFLPVVIMAAIKMYSFYGGPKQG